MATDSVRDGEEITRFDVLGNNESPRWTIPTRAFEMAQEARSRQQAGAANARGEESPVRPNQLWIASRAGESLFLGVVKANDDVAQVVPMDTEGDIYESGESVVPAQFSPLEMSMLAWTSLESMIPVAVLTSFVGYFVGNLSELLKHNMRSEEWLEQHSDDVDTEINEIPALLALLRSKDGI